MKRTDGPPELSADIQTATHLSVPGRLPERKIGWNGEDYLNLFVLTPTRYELAVVCALNGAFSELIVVQPVKNPGLKHTVTSQVRSDGVLQADPQFRITVTKFGVLRPKASSLRSR